MLVATITEYTSEPHGKLNGAAFNYTFATVHVVVDNIVESDSAQIANADVYVMLSLCLIRTL